MSRFGKSFCGGNPFDRRHRGYPYTINDRLVTKAEYRRQWVIAFGDERFGRGALVRQPSARGRKRAIDRQRPRIGCDHEFQYHEEHEDHGCYGTETYRWLECEHCNEQRSATWQDAPTYDFEDY